MTNFNYYLDRLVIKSRGDLHNVLTYNLPDYTLLQPYLHLTFGGKLLCIPAQNSEDIENYVRVFLEYLGFAQVGFQEIESGRYLALCATAKPNKLLLEFQEHCVHAVYKLEYLSQSLRDDTEAYRLVYLKVGDLECRAVAYGGKIITVENRPEYEPFVQATLDRLEAIGYNPSFLKPILVNNQKYIFVV